MRQILIEEGYEDAKEYFICLSDVHPQYWGILGSQSDLCHHCGDKGTIPYYNHLLCFTLIRDRGILMGFFQKMLSCLKVIACSVIHFNNINNSSNSFANHFLVLSLSDVLKCWKMLCAIIHPVYFLYCAIIPRAIDVHIATVSKQDGQHSVEVYTVGFVPSYLLPDAWTIQVTLFRQGGPISHRLVSKGALRYGEIYWFFRVFIWNIFIRVHSSSFIPVIQKIQKIYEKTHSSFWNRFCFLPAFIMHLHVGTFVHHY